MEDDDIITRHQADKLLGAEGLGFDVAFDREVWEKYSDPNGTIHAGFVLDWIAGEVNARIDREE